MVAIKYNRQGITIKLLMQFLRNILPIPNGKDP